MARVPDLMMRAKLKNLKTKPHEKSDDEVVFSLAFELDADLPEAERILQLGATMLNQKLNLAFMGQGSGFERSVADVELVRVAGAATDEATVKLAVEFATRAGLDEMRNLWADFLPSRNYPLTIAGVLQRSQTVMEFAPREAAHA